MVSFFNPELLFKAVTNRKGKITHWLVSISDACTSKLTSKDLIDMTFKYFRNYPLVHYQKLKHGGFEEPQVYCKCPIKFPVGYSCLSGIFLHDRSDSICLASYIDILLKSY